MNRKLLTNLVVFAAVVTLVGTVAILRDGGEALSAADAGTDGQAAPAASMSSGLPRMVDLGADKCIPCKKMAPILAELKSEFAGRATIEFIDVWKNPAAGEPYGVRVIPTQIFFDRDGTEVWRHEGFLSREAIVAKLHELGAG